MDIAKKNEIEACIQGYFVDALMGSDTEEGRCFDKVVRNDSYNEVLPCVSIQWWYCEEYNKVYIYYDSGKVYFVDNKDQFQSRINRRILYSMHNDLAIYPEIVSNIIYGGQYLEPMDSPYVFSDEHITCAVLSYWKIFGNNYHFIHDSHIIINKILDSSRAISPEKEAIVNEYLSKLAVITRNYQAYDVVERNEQIPIVFNQIRDLFMEYFGYKLPDPLTYQLLHPNCGPNYMYLIVYPLDTDSGRWRGNS